MTDIIPLRDRLEASRDKPVDEIEFAAQVLSTSFDLTCLAKTLKHIGDQIFAKPPTGQGTGCPTSATQLNTRSVAAELLAKGRMLNELVDSQENPQ